MFVEKKINTPEDQEEKFAKRPARTKRSTRREQALLEKTLESANMQLADENMALIAVSHAQDERENAESRKDEPRGNKSAVNSPSNSIVAGVSRFVSRLLGDGED